MDVLTLFRKYGKSLDSIVESDDEKSIKFGDESVVVAMSDPIRLKDGNRTGFTVASLYYFLKIVKKEKIAKKSYQKFVFSRAQCPRCARRYTHVTHSTSNQSSTSENPTVKYDS